MTNWVEKKFGTDMYQFKLGEVVEGELKEIRENVGKNESTVYTVGDKTFWGTSVLDVLLADIPIGKMVRITMTDENYKFPNGRFGRNFKVEVGR
jgi:hypothetical protein